MNKKLVGIVGFWFLSLGMWGQKSADFVDIQWGDNAPLLKKHIRAGFIGNPKTGYVQVSENLKKKEIGLYRFSSDLKYEGNNMENMMKSKYIMFETIVEFDNRAFFLFSDFDKANQSEKLYVQEVDLLEGKFLDSPMQLIETNRKVTGTYIATGFYSFSVTDKFKVIAPDNSDRILLYYKYKNEKKRDAKNYEKYEFHLYDRSWKQIWNKEVTMPHTEAEMRILNFRLVGDEVFTFVESMSGRLNPETKKPEFDELGVLHITKDAKEPKEYSLEMDKLYFKDLIFGLGFGNKIMIGGYIQPKKRVTTFTGYFTAVFNPETKSLESVNQYAFSGELITSFEKDRTKRKLEKAIAKGKEPGIPFLETRMIRKKQDGGWIMVGEQYHLVVTTSTDSRGNVRYTYHYYFQDMIVSSVGPDGAEQWTLKVPKNQHFINSTYGAGISSFVHNDNVYLFHLDNVKNINLPDSNAPVEFRSFKDGCLMAIKIDPSGKMNRVRLFDLRDEQKMILPYDMDEVAPGLILSSSRRSGRGAKNTNTPALIRLK
ncbi:MAG: hypothetical protein MH137_09515 [Flavobacteriales bacterium]|nr:hypothetical protein [Flavobacteriales bacterium]